MTPQPISNRILSNGTYQLTGFNSAPGTSVIVEVDGTFGSGTVTFGYASSTGTFVAYPASGAPPLTAAGGYRVDVPASGTLAVLLAGATNPSLQVNVTSTPK